MTTFQNGVKHMHTTVNGYFDKNISMYLAETVFENESTMLYIEKLVKQPMKFMDTKVFFLNSCCYFID